MNPKYHLKRLHDGRDIPLSRPSMLVGRGSSCHIVVEQGYPSREHARIVQKADGIYVEDLHSTNGTYVNNRRINEATRVQRGDVIKVGDESFTVLAEDESDMTIISGKLAPTTDQSVSSVVSEEEDDPEATNIQQSYPLPPGWGASDSQQLGADQVEQGGHSKAVIDALLKEGLAGREDLVSAALIVFQGSQPPRVYGFSLDSGAKQWSIGRKSDSDVPINDPSISELHARLVNEGGHWLLRDNKSTNGIRFAGRLQKEVTLSDGSSLLLGRVEVVFRQVDVLSN